jgi:hypothetical protein
MFLFESLFKSTVSTLIIDISIYQESSLCVWILNLLSLLNSLIYILNCGSLIMKWWSNPSIFMISLVQWRCEALLKLVVMMRSLDTNFTCNHFHFLFIKRYIILSFLMAVLLCYVFLAMTWLPLWYSRTCRIHCV